jgi:YD repeat-containing protein
VGGSSVARVGSGLSYGVLSRTDFLGRTTTFQRDALGYVTSEMLPGGATLGFVYQDAFHDLVSATDARGGVTTNAYDAQGHLTSTTAADGGVTVYGYTAEGLMTSVTDPLGHTTAYAYDADLLCRDRSASDFFILSGAQNFGALAQAPEKVNPANDLRCATPLRQVPQWRKELAHKCASRRQIVHFCQPCPTPGFRIDRPLCRVYYDLIGRGERS